MEHSAVPGYTRALQRGYGVEESFREHTYLDAPEFISGIEIGPLTFQAYLQLCHARSPFLVGGNAFISDIAVFLFRLSPTYKHAFKAKDAARQEIARVRSLGTARLRAIARNNDLRPVFVVRLGRRERNIGRFLPLALRRRSALIALLEDHAEVIARNAFASIKRSFVKNVALLPIRELDPLLHKTMRAIDRFIDRMLLDQPIAPGRKNPSLDPSDTSFAEDVIHIIARARNWSRDAILRMPMPEVFQALRKIQREDKDCPKRYRAKVHPLATRFTKRHRAIARAAAKAAAAGIQPIHGSPVTIH